MGVYPQDALDVLQAQHDKQLRLFETQVQFIGEPYTPSAGVKTQAVTIECTSAQAVRIISSEVSQIKIVIDSGSASGKKLKSADGKVVGTVDASITVPVVEGQAKIIFEASSTGSWVLSLDGSVDARADELSTTDIGNGTFS